MIIGFRNFLARSRSRSFRSISLAVAGCLSVANLCRSADVELLYDLSGNLESQIPASLALPQILAQPQNQVAEPGKLASFSVVVADTRSLSYQWQFNGTSIPNATADALVVTNAGPAQEGLYTVVLSNPSGSVTSAPAALWIDSDGDGLADSWEQTYFGSLNQNATGDWDGDGVPNSTEFLDGTNPTNSGSALFRLTVLKDGGFVSVTPMKLSYTTGEMVTLTATAIAPDSFHAWHGDVTSTNNPLTLTLSSNMTVVALLASYTIRWVNTGSGSWDVATNWDLNIVPRSNDAVLITRGGTITLNNTAECGALTFGSASGSPTLSGTGTLTVFKDSSWTRGTMAGAGRTVIAPGATLTINNVSSIDLNPRSLDNAGTILWTGSGALVMASSVITNRPGALFQVQNSAPFQLNTGLNRVDNAGTFRKTSSGTTTFYSNISLNNYDTVEVQAGTLFLDGGGLNNSNITVAGGATLNISGGTYTGSAASSITGAGNLVVSGSTSSLAGLLNLTGSHTFSGGTANLTGNYFCTNNTLTISGGVANFNGTGLVAPNVINLSGGTMGGGNMVTPLQQMTWSGGTMGGGGRTVIPSGVTLIINNVSSIDLNPRTLDNAGTILWTGSGALVMASSVITNRPGALFQVQNSAPFQLNTGLNRVDNAGTFRKTSSGTTTFYSNISLNNYDTVEVQAGTLFLDGGGLNNSNITVAGGATLNISGGTYTGSAASSITGAGNLVVSGSTSSLAGLLNLTGSHAFSGGTANLTGNYFCTNNTLTISGGVANFNGTGLVAPNVINLSGGTMGGGNMVTPLQQMTWSGGTMGGGGRTVIPSGVTLTINNVSSIDLNPRTLDNAGTILWTGSGALVMASSVITNRPGALFQVQNSAPFQLNTGLNRVDNAGTFRKTSSGTTTFYSNVRLNNYGTLALQNGIIAATGGYAGSSGSTLACTIKGTSSGTDYAQLQASGTVNLTGALSVSFTNGFVPAISNTFTVLTAGTRSGAFATFSYPSNLVTMQLSNAPTAVILSVTGVVAPPLTLLSPQIIGSDLRLAWNAVSNTTYRVEFNPDLIISNWTGLPGDVTATSTIATKLDPVSTSNRFYRVRVLP